MRNHCLTAVLAILGLLGIAVETEADLIVSVGDLNLQPGGEGFIDIRIESDEILGDPLQRFDLKLLITPNGVPTRLDFVSPQPNPATFGADYVFSGNSFKANFGLAFGNVGQTTVPNDTFTGGDFTALFGSTATVDRQFLLGRVAVTADTVLPPIAGDQFTIAVVDSGTKFLDASFAPILFTSTPGTVTIAQVSAVPEPSSLALLGVGMLSLSGYGWRRHRRHG